MLSLINYFILLQPTSLKQVKIEIFLFISNIKLIFNDVIELKLYSYVNNKVMEL